MQYEVSFGRLGGPSKPPSGAVGRFRLAVLGDFSGRANKGVVADRAALAARKPLRVDAETLDDVIARLDPSPRLVLAEGEAPVTVPVAGMDDFHPDQIVEKVDLFGELLMLRRNLASKSGFERAAKQVLAWGGEPPLPPPPRRARGTAVATDLRLDDFARLIGRTPDAAAGKGEGGEGAAGDLIRRLVGPYIEPARDARQDALVARVDEALSAALRRVLHHADFQAAEALWRGVDFLVRRLETDAKLHVVLYDLSAEEFAADLAAADPLEESALYRLLVEQPAEDAAAGPLSAVIGLYRFEASPPHADLLGRAAQITAAGGAPFVAGFRPDALKTPLEEQHPLIRAAFEALRTSPAAAWLGLASPRFLLRLPYGRKSDPIERFAFEEFTRQSGLSGMLWGEAALLPGLLLAQAWSRQGAKLQPGAVLSAGDMPYHVITDADGDQVALPCTERLWSEREAMRVAAWRVMPLLSLRGRTEVRLGGFVAQSGGKLAGFWAPAPIVAPAPPSAPPPARAPGPVVTPVVAPVAAPVAAPDAPPPPAEAAAPVPSSVPEPIAEPIVSPMPGPVSEPAPEPAAAERALDSLLADLAPPAPDTAEPAAGAPAGEASHGMDALDSLLADSGSAPPLSELDDIDPDETEPDLKALLASLKV